MPPCGDNQQDVSLAVAGVLYVWVRTHPEFVAGANEAGMILAGETRGADAAVWRRREAGPRTGRYRRSAPCLAVEVAGLDENEDALREKARWYLGSGVEVVWIVLPETREVLVLTPHAESRHPAGKTLPTHPALPDLTPAVSDFFVQL